MISTARSFFNKFFLVLVAIFAANTWTSAAEPVTAEARSKRVRPQPTLNLVAPVHSTVVEPGATVNVVWDASWSARKRVTLELFQGDTLKWEAWNVYSSKAKKISRATRTSPAVYRFEQKLLIPADSLAGANYKVRLTVSILGWWGATIYTYSEQFTVGAPVAQNITVSAVSGPSSLTTGTSGSWFVSASGPGTLSYTVTSYGDGTSAPTQSSATFSHSYTAPGTYTQVYVVSNGGLSDNVSRSFTVTVTNGGGGGGNTGANLKPLSIDISPNKASYNRETVTISVTVTNTGSTDSGKWDSQLRVTPAGYLVGADTQRASLAAGAQTTLTYTVELTGTNGQNSLEFRVLTFIGDASDDVILKSFNYTGN